MCDHSGCNKKAVKTVSVKWPYIGHKEYRLCEEHLQGAKVVICRSGIATDKVEYQ